MLLETTLWWCGKQYGTVACVNKDLHFQVLPEATSFNMVAEKFLGHLIYLSEHGNQADVKPYMSLCKNNKRTLICSWAKGAYIVLSSALMI